MVYSVNYMFDIIWDENNLSFFFFKLSYFIDSGFITVADRGLEYRSVYE